jgi:hypothetical protein
MIIAHWKCNDNAASTTVLDSVGSSNGVYTDNAAGVNTSTGTTASNNYVGSCLDLDTDEWINVGNQGGSVKSISIWCNPDAVNVTDYLIDLNGTDYITIVNGTVTVNGFAASTEVIYVDGVVASTVTANWHHIVVTATAAFTASDLDIGRLEGSGYFNGIIDNVMLFDHTLHAEQVKKLYNGGHGTEIPAVIDIDRRIKRR